MAYINNTTIDIYEILKLGYMRNMHKQTCNPILAVRLQMDITNNKLVRCVYEVSAFTRRDTVGYTNSHFDNYDDALTFFKLHIDSYHHELEELA